MGDELLHWNRTTPFDDIVTHQHRFIRSFPLETAVPHCNVKATGDPSQTNSDVCCLDSYPVINNLVNCIEKWISHS